MTEESARRVVQFNRFQTIPSLVTAVVTAYTGYVAWYNPGAPLEPFMPWAWPLVVAFVGLTVLESAHWISGYHSPLRPVVDND